MSKRDSYYQSQSCYHHLTEWKQLIDEKNTRAAISYWNAKGLKATDSYVKIRTDSWVPVLYYCCLKAEYAEMARVLLMQGADPTQLPDSENACLLPFVCHSLYLKTLAKRNKKEYKCNAMLKRSIDGRLNVGDVRRLSNLVILGFLTNESIKSFIHDHKDIITEKLKVMVKYLTFTYNIRTQQPTDQVLNLTEETSTTIKKFHDTVWYLLHHGAKVNAETMKLCVDNYLYEIIPLFNGVVPVVEPKYHTQMDSTRVAIIRPLLNDQRYVLTCKATGYKPDPDVFNFNIMG